MAYTLLLKWGCQRTSIKSLFKNINKNYNLILVVMVPYETTTRGEKNNIDEIK